jgi:hypothetical protein
MATSGSALIDKIAIADIDDLTASLAWFTELLPQTAHEELAAEQARGNLQDPTVFVDGKKSTEAAVDMVKPFGEIQYVSGVGPMDAAIAAADAFVRSKAPRRTGHYAASLVWFANGQRRGAAPAARSVGIKGNVELVDLAPYASMAEIQVPSGVIYGAYTMLQRAFGGQLSIGFRYTQAAIFGGFEIGPGKPAPARPYNVPVLTIGNPVSSVKPGVKRSTPGYNRRRNRRTVRKYLKERGGK